MIFICGLFSAEMHWFEIENVCFSGTFGHCDRVSELWWYQSLPNLQHQRAVHEVLCSGETPQTCNNWLVWILLIIQVLVAWFSEGIRWQCYIPLIINYHMHMAWYLQDKCPKNMVLPWCISKSHFISIVAFPKTCIGSFGYVLVSEDVVKIMLLPDCLEKYMSMNVGVNLRQNRSPRLLKRCP